MIKQNLLKALSLTAFALFSQCILNASRIEVTYIANEGFLLRSGDSKVLIDALFDEGSYDLFLVPSEETRTKMIDGIPPFDDIDLILFTHRHWDHFDPSVAAQFLKKHPETMLVGPPQAVDEMKDLEDFQQFSDQVKAVDLELDEETELSINGVAMTIARLEHGPFMKDGVNVHKDVENLVYHLDLNGTGIMHVGDAGIYSSQKYFKEKDFEKNRVDILFSSRFDRGPFSKSIITERMKPEVIIPMHIPPGEWENVTAKFKKVYPSAIAFRTSLESRSFEFSGLAENN